MEIIAIKLGDYESRLGGLYKNWRTPEATYNWGILTDDTLVISDVDNHVVVLSLFLIREEGVPDEAFRDRFREIKEEIQSGRHLNRVRWGGTCDGEASVQHWSAPSLVVSEPEMLHRSGIFSRLREAVRLFDGYKLPPGTGEFSPPF